MTSSRRTALSAIRVLAVPALALVLAGCGLSLTIPTATPFVIPTTPTPRATPRAWA